MLHMNNWICQSIPSPLLQMHISLLLISIAMCLSMGQVSHIYICPTRLIGLYVALDSISSVLDTIVFPVMYHRIPDQYYYKLFKVT